MMRKIISLPKIHSNEFTRNMYDSVSLWIKRNKIRILCEEELSISCNIYALINTSTNQNRLIRPLKENELMVRLSGIRIRIEKNQFCKQLKTDHDLIK